MAWGRYALAATAAASLAAFAAYCVYFDRQRRADHDYKNRLRQRKIQEQQEKAAGSMQRLGKIVNFESIDEFFLEELKTGRQLLTTGDLNGASEHLCNAIVVAPQPDELLKTLQLAVTPSAYERLLLQLPAARKRLKAALAINSATL